MSYYVHFKTYQKVISAFLVVCFLTIPLTFLTFPKKAEATCVPFSIPLIPAPTSVPTHNDPASVSNQADNLQKGTAWFKECVLDGLATLIAKTIIRALTQSIVQWINSGFKGNPSFIQNSGKFFSGIADKVAGNMIERVAPFLCSPFRLNIQLGLAGSMTTSAYDEISCTLTDVENNFRDFANNSSVGVSASWDNWYDITQNPQNNPYGAMMIAQSQMSFSIETAQGKYEQQANWGRGFLSFEDCSSDMNGVFEDGSYVNPYNVDDTQVYDQNDQPIYGVQAGDNNCVTKTPGAVIESQLQNTIGSDLRGLEIAQSIDQIVAALVGQLVTQALGGIGGLLGASDGSAGGGSGFNYRSSIPNVPLAGHCLPNTTKAKIGETVSWDAYVSDLNGEVNYEWFGDEGLAGDFPSLTKEYTSSGTKTAGVVVSTFGENAQTIILDCVQNIEVTDGDSLIDSTAPIISCYPSTNTVSARSRTPITWQVTVSGGTPPFTHYWYLDGSDDLEGAGQSIVKTYTTQGTKTASVDVVGTNGAYYSKVCGGTVIVTR